MRSLALSLITKGKIQTTEVKAKALRPYVEKLVSNGKKQTLAARREIASMIGPRGAHVVLGTIAPKYVDRKGGYVRIVKLMPRESDGAKQAIIEFV